MLRVVLLILATSTVLPLNSSASCGLASIALGQCTYTEQGLEISGQQTSGVPTPAYQAFAANYDQAAARAAWLAFVAQQNALCDDMAEAREQCFYFAPADPDVPESAPAASITIADLAAFTPATGTIETQPGYGIVGIPLTVVSTATPHVQTGTLLGSPVTVRWTPVSWTIDFGDGTVVSTTDPGRPQEGALRDWVDAPTSHRYTDRTDRTITVTIEFVAEVDAGTGWFLVPGSLRVQAPPLDLKIYEVQTLLVRGDCVQYPSDPGCGAP